MARIQGSGSGMEGLGLRTRIGFLGEGHGVAG